MALDPDITKREGFTEKREAFCQLIIGLGVDLHAYRLAYNAENQSDASASVSAYEIKRTRYCQERLAELREGVALQNKFDAAEAYREAMQAYTEAMTARKYAAAASFLALACKINGHGTERVDLTSGGKPIDKPTKIMIGVLGEDD